MTGRDLGRLGAMTAKIVGYTIRDTENHDRSNVVLHLQDGNEASDLIVPVSREFLDEIREPLAREAERAKP
jgi:hypothetical protein